MFRLAAPPRLPLLAPLPALAVRRARISGLTLIELMVTLAIMAMVGFLATPSLRAIAASNALRGTTAEFLSAVQLGRSEALRLGRRVTLCRSFDQATCDTDANRRWDSGWIIFIDNDRGNSGAPAVSPSDVILARRGPVTADLRLVGNTPVADFLSFASDGRGKTMQGSFLVGTLRVCSTSSALKDQQRSIDLVLSKSGRVTVNAGIPVDAQCPAKCSSC